MPSVWKQPLPLHLEVESEVNMLSARLQNHHGMSVVDTVKAIIIVGYIKEIFKRDYNLRAMLIFEDCY